MMLIFCSFGTVIISILDSSSYNHQKMISQCFFLYIEQKNSKRPCPVSADHKRRKLDSHSSPSHSSSVKVSMAWGRLYPFLLSLPEHTLPLHIPAALKITKESCHTCIEAWLLDIPTQSMGDGWNSMDISIIFWRNGRKPPQGQKNIVYIKYFSYWKKIYFYINESSQCALAKKNFFKSISIFLVDFFLFWKLYQPKEKWHVKARAFAFYKGKDFSSFNTGSSVQLLEMVPKIIFPVFGKMRRFPC